MPVKLDASGHHTHAVLQTRHAHANAEIVQIWAVLAAAM